jgi:hypothetical protein
LQLSRPEYNSRQIRVNPLSALSLLADDEQLNGRGPVTASDGVTDTVISVHYTSVCLSLRHTSIGSLRLVVQSGTRTWNLIETTNKTPLRDFSATGPKERKTPRVGCRISRFFSEISSTHIAPVWPGSRDLRGQTRRGNQQSGRAPQPMDRGLGQRTLQSNQRCSHSH